MVTALKIIVIFLSIFGKVYVLLGNASMLTISAETTGQFDLISRVPNAESKDVIHLSLLFIDERLAVWSKACSSAHCANFCDSLRLELTAFELAKKLQHKNKP